MNGDNFNVLAKRYFTIPEAMPYVMMFMHGICPGLDYEKNTMVASLYDEWVRNDKADNYIFVIPRNVYSGLLGMFEKEDKK